MIPETKLDTIFCKPKPIPTDKAPAITVSEFKLSPIDFKDDKNAIMSIR